MNNKRKMKKKKKENLKKKEKRLVELRVFLSDKSACPASTRPCVPFLASQKLKRIIIECISRDGLRKECNPWA
jgi:hypothetical protein